ncbi:tRNA (5-methylaminomethyl-2-thiouridine)(34)-methyltransferase MnmD [Roseicyclus mahoneyensis]|uniref:tRNA U34 5-methylaminomethyl-2-thiouridine-forming methyltransferase MnmC n=1 Tax=Roseicyclus mahoneyensis TaxID=164332 RepID=A0A316GGQ3_9RHOB|nr:tRNA (5-methylaminomethyl-2-thiouridine)(34)-methyltransferase MnmD [Roseicyclus mahoneyensis]PWK60229.1 tRNA U34 5-methylaminomethyl-2-thiouridine-forming methyltransferase MnmC [Roseicyclus mahoneyensis]
MDQPRHDIDWRDMGAGLRVPVSRRFDDPFYSLDNGLAETRHVFLSGNDLPARFRPGFHIAELGFGTGLNLVAAALAWAAAGTQGPLTFTSFEAFPLSGHDARAALAAFPEAAPLTDAIARALDNDGRIETPTLSARIVMGDARRTVPAWDGMADAWFLDGFAPARNPELWEPALLQAVAAHTAPEGTCATYSAAGHVRAALADAGFAVARLPGYGRKRHMTIGRMA